MKLPPIFRSSLLALVAATALPAEARDTLWQQHGALRVSENRRYLVHADGRPFFWLGDTAWELFHRLSREEASRYLETRQRQGFTVIQAVALAEFAGLTTPNAYGHLPLQELDPTRPAEQPGPENDYWDHVDFIMREAAAHNLIVGFLPTWGDKWNKKWGDGPEIFTPENARQYGEWLGRRYKDAPLVWILGGDRPVETEGHREIIRAMAAGLRKGDGGAHLITFHPTGGRGSSEYFHDEPWLDFNMRQNGHVQEFNSSKPENPRGYETTRRDYDRQPVKPVIDGEPLYEGHPLAFNQKAFGHSVAADVRRPLYWDLFTGACGHTYGHHSIWQFWAPERAPKNDPLVPWTEALTAPGAEQMKRARSLLESRPFLSRIPDDSLLVPDRVVTAVPGAGTRRLVATRDAEGSYAMIYVPVSRRFRVRLEALSGEKLRATWYDPRGGPVQTIGEFAREKEKEFVPPNEGELQDWILVLDDVAKHPSPPGWVLEKRW